MIIHPHIKMLLYDYLQDKLPPEEHKQVDEHLATCIRCADEAKFLRTIIKILPDVTVQPNEKLSAEYWQNFAAAVESRIQAAQQGQKQFKPSLLQLITQFVVFNRRYVTTLSAALAIAVVLVVIWRWPNPVPVEQPQVQIMPQSAPIELASDRIHQYFDKSKVLLVGITNMKTDERQDIDLSAEQRVSRELIHEARYLKRQPLDNRSAKLINDLEKILIELANMKEEADVPNVELIRGGIHQENLLFKIRMAENTYDSVEVHQPHQPF